MLILTYGQGASIQQVIGVLVFAVFAVLVIRGGFIERKKSDDPHERRMREWEDLAKRRSYLWQ